MRIAARVGYLARVADHIQLEIPLQTRFASTVRAVAAAVCADLGFTVDDIDDLRLAINEAVSVLSDVDGDGRLQIDLESGDDEVVVRCARRHAGAELTDDDVDPLARRILDAVVDEYAVAGGEFRIVKRLNPGTRDGG